MKTRLKTLLLLTPLWLLLLWLPRSATSAGAANKLHIVTVNYPLAYFAERIADDLAQVSFPAPADIDPAFWMPDTATISDYQQADLILLNGAGYAHWTARVSLPRLRSVDSSRTFRDRYIQVQQGPQHSHGASGKHSHGGTAFTTWLDLDQAAQQADAIAAALRRKRPDQTQAIDSQLAKLQSQLETLDQRLRQAGASAKDRPLLASHPIYQYLARRYGLKLRSVTWEPDRTPEPAQWALLEQLLAEHPARLMLWEDTPTAATSERLQQLGVEVVVFNPSANRPAHGDFLTVMSDNVAGLTAALAQK